MKQIADLTELELLIALSDTEKELIRWDSQLKAIQQEIRNRVDAAKKVAEVVAEEVK